MNQRSPRWLRLIVLPSVQSTRLLSTSFPPSISASPHSHHSPCRRSRRPWDPAREGGREEGRNRGRKVGKSIYPCRRNARPYAELSKRLPRIPESSLIRFSATRRLILDDKLPA